MPHLSKLLIALLTFTVLCLGSATVARADTITFTGSSVSFNNPPPAPNPGRCSIAPHLLVSPNDGTGTSNLGAFTKQESFCFDVFTGNLYDGLFTYDFANGSTLLGTISGTAMAPVNGIQTTSLILSITGGSGLFAGATGTLLGVGTVTFLPNGLANGVTTLNGTINTVPEPATMLLLGTGLAGVGAAVRKRRKKGVE